MLRILLLFVLFLIFFTGIIFYLVQEPGVASFTYGDLLIELPLVKFTIGIFIVFAIMYIIIRIVGSLYNAPKRFQKAAKQRKKQKAFATTKKGLNRFLQGDWKQSENLLLSAVNEFGNNFTNYAWAACSAHQLGKYDTRDKYFESAKKAAEKTDSTIDILRSELLLDQGLPEQALAALNKINHGALANSKIATLYVTAYSQLKDWDKLIELIPKLHKFVGFNQEKIAKLQQLTVRGLLQSNDSIMISDLAKQYKDAILNDEELALQYVNALCNDKNYDKAEQFITNFIDKQWSSKLVHQYGLLSVEDPNASLDQVEKWITNHKNDANLYLTLGRLCMKAKLWGKSKSYLESSISRKPLAETYAELARLHEQLNEMDDAHKCAKKGLKLATKIG